MSPDTQITPAEPPATSPLPATSNSEPANLSAFRGNGKIARLPKNIRDQINHWLLDGLSYPQIVERLVLVAYPLVPFSSELVWRVASQ
jgi:hypothetical protein